MIHVSNKFGTFDAISKSDPSYAVITDASLLMRFG